MQGVLLLLLLLQRLLLHEALPMAASRSRSVLRQRRCKNEQMLQLLLRTVSILWREHDLMLLQLMQL